MRVKPEKREVVKPIVWNVGPSRTVWEEKLMETLLNQMNGVQRLNWYGFVISNGAKC